MPLFPYPLPGCLHCPAACMQQPYTACFHACAPLQSAYLECDGNSSAGTLVEDGLGELEAPGGETSVPAVFSWVTNGAALPGAIGTRGCDCDEIYGNGTLGALCRGAALVVTAGFAARGKAG